MRSFFAKMVLLAAVLSGCSTESLEDDAADSTPAPIPTGHEGPQPAAGTITTIGMQPARVSSSLMAVGAARLDGTFRDTRPRDPTGSPGSEPGSIGPTGSSGDGPGPTTSTGTDPGPAPGDGGDELPAQLTDKITLRDPAQIEARRVALRRFLFGTTTLPASLAVLHPNADNCAAPGLTGVAKIEELRVPMDEGQEGLACHYVASAHNGRLVIFNPGHFYTVSDDSDADNDGWANYGNQRTVQGLLSQGDSVLVVFMPHYRPDDAPSVTYGLPDPHIGMFATLHPATGSVWRYFIEPVIAGINYVTGPAVGYQFPQYTEIDMLGLSGGGWTTVVTAAIDTRIHTSIQVSGSEPLEFWDDYQNNDEQTLPGLYRVAAYRDLYIMDAAGAGRQHVQVLNRHDSCCFFPGWMNGAADQWETAVNGYASAIRAQLGGMGALGTFTLQIDDTATAHQISRVALQKIIVPTLAGGVVYGTSS